jgi:hypothetical protein
VVLLNYVDFSLLHSLLQWAICQESLLSLAISSLVFPSVLLLI